MSSLCQRRGRDARADRSGEEALSFDSTEDMNNLIKIMVTKDYNWNSGEILLDMSKKLRVQKIWSFLQHEIIFCAPMEHAFSRCLKVLKLFGSLRRGRQSSCPDLLSPVL